MSVMIVKCCRLIGVGLVLSLASLLSSAQSVTVKGHVTAAKGYVPPLLKVVLIDRQNPGYKIPAKITDQSTGAFEIRNVQQGTYDVVACAGTKYSPSQLQIEVMAGKVPPADITLILATNHKRIKANVPIKKGMTVTALGHGCAVATMTTTSLPLYFEELPIPPEKYQFEAVLPNGRRLTSRLVTLAGEATAVNLSFDMNKDGMEVALIAESLPEIIDPGIDSKNILAGTVVDPLGIAVAGVRVIATNELTRVSYEISTNEDGRYSLVVPPGQYRVEATATGFKTYLQTDVLVAANQISNLDLNLSIGFIGETVTTQ